MKPPYYIVSFSGGKDSTAMLLKLVEEGRQIDEILFCDTGLEFPEMYNHIRQVEKYIDRKITILKSEYSFEYYLFDHEFKKGSRKGRKGYGFPSNRLRWCTDRLKQKPIKYHLLELEEKYDVKEYVGIAYDEKHRVKDKIYPLVEWKMTEADCLQYCYDKGFTWGGLYRFFDRVSCWCCPLQKLHNIRTLRKYFPELWSQVLEWQSRTESSFRLDFNAFELDTRFWYEDKYLKTKDFKLKWKEFYEKRSDKTS